MNKFSQKQTPIKVWYLYHSGFAVKTQNHFLIFDYYTKPNTPFYGSLKDGRISIEEIKEEKVIVFSSHSHPDHYDKRIFEWRSKMPHIQYVLSDDITNMKSFQKEEVLSVHFNKEYTLGDIKISTLHSTDEGVAFLIEIDGITIYHAGDLNWWHWNGEIKQYNDTMAGQYKHEIDLLKGKSIDIAFLPMDPRLEDKYLLGVDYFMKNINPEVVFPMHFGDNYNVFDWLSKDEQADDYKKRIQIIADIGQQFSIHH